MTGTRRKWSLSDAMSASFESPFSATPVYEDRTSSQSQSQSQSQVATTAVCDRSLRTAIMASTRAIVASGLVEPGTEFESVRDDTVFHDSLDFRRSQSLARDVNPITA